MTAGKTRAKTAQAKKSRRIPVGWNTRDDDERARRELRAQQESFAIEPAAGDDGGGLDWRVTGDSGAAYPVEVRAVDSAINSCACQDFLINRLGTCKHIEAAPGRQAIKKCVPKPMTSRRVEPFLDRRDMRVKCRFAGGMRRHARARLLVAKFFDDAGTLCGEPLQSITALKNNLAKETPRVRKQLRISPHLEQWLETLHEAAARRTARRRFEHNLKHGRASLDVTTLPLYPYQQEGVMNLAFTGRALLADEMGLGVHHRVPHAGCAAPQDHARR